MFSKFIRQWSGQWSGIKNMYAIKDQYDVKGKEKAIRTRERLALIYAFIAWNSFGIMFYMLLKNRIPTDPVERRAALQDLTGASGNLYVCKVQGFTVTEEFKMEHKEPKDTEEDE